MNPIETAGASRRGTAGGVAAAAVALLAAALSIPAYAGLGGDAASIARDHVALRGITHTVTPTQLYDLHEITLAGGTTVHEYVTRAGQVFAVTWSGPSIPDLKTMLADHYADYLNAATTPHGSHHVLVVRNATIELQMIKLLRGHVGSARVLALTPPGVDLRALR